MIASLAWFKTNVLDHIPGVLLGIVIGAPIFIVLVAVGIIHTVFCLMHVAGHKAVHNITEPALDGIIAIVNWMLKKIGLESVGPR